MIVSLSEWLKDPAKWMKKTTEYHNSMGATRENFQQWAQTPEGQQRLKEYMEKEGYTLDEDGNWVKKNDQIRWL
jgi:hypothetical protein